MEHAKMPKLCSGKVNCAFVAYNARLCMNMNIECEIKIV